MRIRESGVLKDLHFIYESKDAIAFLRRSNEVLDKWRSAEKSSNLEQFADYFEKQWVKRPFNRWWMGCSKPGVAHTNNALESFNNAIKQKYTHRKRLTLVNYFDMLLSTLIEKESWDRLEIGNQKRFVDKRELKITRSQVK